VAAWETALTEDFDHDFLVEGFRTGFRVVPKGEVILPARVHNYRSCYNSVAMPRIDEQIHHEIAAGRFLEVESHVPYRIQAMAAIPKKNSTKVRIITDCSKPRGNCINDHIPSPPFKYSSVESAMHLMSTVSPHGGAWMTVLDISEAFRQVPIHPSQWRYFGISWRHKFYLDTRMCFGLRNAPWLFDRVGQAIIRTIRRQGFHAQIYVDDIFICEHSKSRCLQATAYVIRLLRSLGWNINNKIQRCQQVVQYLGVELDSTSMQARLSPSKLADLHSEIIYTLNLRKITKRGLQSLVGKLNWACKVVYGGRTFLRRLLDVMNNLREPYYFT